MLFLGLGLQNSSKMYQTLGEVQCITQWNSSSQLLPHSRNVTGSSPCSWTSQCCVNFVEIKRSLSEPFLIYLLKNVTTLIPRKLQMTNSFCDSNPEPQYFTFLPVKPEHPWKSYSPREVKKKKKRKKLTKEHKYLKSAQVQGLDETSSSIALLKWQEFHSRLKYIKDDFNGA